MKHLVAFGFVLIISSVAGQEVFQTCMTVASYLMHINPGSTCAYWEDAVRCGISDAGLTKDMANQTEIEMSRMMSNGLLSSYNCSVTFDDILNAVKTNPELLELQGCMDAVMDKNIQDPEFFMTCDVLKQAIKCGIGSLKLYDENASAAVVKSFKSFANNQVSNLNCDVTFDEILKEVKANPEMLVQECDDDDHATDEEGSQQERHVDETCDEIEKSVHCGIKVYEFYKNVPPNDYLMSYRASQNMDLTKHKCNITFDDILNQVKANPELLDNLPGCSVEADDDDLTRCDRIEGGVRCGIRALKLDKDEASNDELMYGKQFASRYLTPFRCKTFDVILKEEKEKNACSTVSPVGWLTAVMVAFIFTFTAVY